MQYDGFMDLTDIVRTRRELDWNDIFLGWRENVSGEEYDVSADII